jgi:hypothetical protein
MRIKEEQTLYDAHGKRTHVVLPVRRYEELLKRLEDADDLGSMIKVEGKKNIAWRAAGKRLRKKA